MDQNIHFLIIKLNQILEDGSVNFRGIGYIYTWFKNEDIHSSYTKSGPLTLFVFAFKDIFRDLALNL